MKYSLLALGLMCLSLSRLSFGQAQISILEAENDASLQLEIEELVESSQDSITLSRSLTRVVREWRESGYLQANIDRFNYGNGSDPEIIAYIGPHYDWAFLRIHGIPDALQSKLSRYPGKLTDNPVKVNEVVKLLHEAIRYSEDHGYPFAEIKVDSIVATGGLVSASLIYNPGPYITWDSLHIEGNVPVKSSYLGAYLGILPGKPFRQKVLDEMESKLSYLPFLQTSEPIKISFQNEECRVTLVLKPRKSNRFDAIIGLLPNEKSGTELLITGDVDLELNNLFKSGKSLVFHWDKPQVETQTLDIKYTHPNLFLSPLGFSFLFNLYKQDTSFINRQIGAAFDYLDVSNNSISFFTIWESSRLISTSQYLGDTTLPDITDYNTNYVGVRFRKLPNIFEGNAPSAYWGVDVSSAFGTKSILKNQDIDEALYSNIALRSNQFMGKLKVEGLAHLMKNYFLMARVKGGTLINSQLFRNELFRLGGLNSIRGFNDNFFFVSDYAIGTLELQLYFNGISNMFVFYDQGFINQNIENGTLEDSPFGFGVGTRLASESGVFTLVYALGQSANQPLDFRYSKIHFGYLARF